MPAKFVVDFGDLEMSGEMRSRIAKAIQSAALHAVAELDYEGDLVARLPHGWNGGLIARREQMKTLEERSQAIEQLGLSKSFVVDLGDIEMSPATQNKLEMDIQSAALSAVAGMDFHGDLVCRFPRGWYGGIIARRELAGRIDSVAERIQKYVGA